MTWDLNEEWVKRARDRDYIAHGGHGVTSWKWDNAGALLWLVCSCGSKVCVNHGDLKATSSPRCEHGVIRVRCHDCATTPAWLDPAVEQRWHDEDEDEERDRKRENPRCEHGLLKSNGCLDCEAPAPVTCTRGESTNRTLQRISTELGKVRTENAALSGAMAGISDRNAELEDEVATLRARVVELEAHVDDPALTAPAFMNGMVEAALWKRLPKHHGHKVRSWGLSSSKEVVNVWCECDLGKWSAWLGVDSVAAEEEAVVNALAATIGTITATPPTHARVSPDVMRESLRALSGEGPDRPSAVATTPPFKFHRGPVIRSDGGE